MITNINAEVEVKLKNDEFVPGKTIEVDIDQMKDMDSSIYNAWLEKDIEYKWYLDGMIISNQTSNKLTIKEEYTSDDAVEGLDVSLLQKYVLDPIFGIKNPKTDNRIDFVGGIRGLSELEKRNKVDCSAAFSMYPTSISELFAVADEGKLMPPKSTWFEPKLRSGLFIHKI